VLVAFVGFGLGNLSLRLSFISGFLEANTSASSV
jgi:hypothetical protein